VANAIYSSSLTTYTVLRLQLGDTFIFYETQILEPADSDCLPVKRLYGKYKCPEGEKEWKWGWVSLTGRIVTDSNPLVRIIESYNATTEIPASEACASKSSESSIATIQHRIIDGGSSPAKTNQLSTNQTTKNVAKLCPICNIVFSLSVNSSEIESHIEKCLQQYKDMFDDDI
jgi:hypothetical protein